MSLRSGLWIGGVVLVVALGLPVLTRAQLDDAGYIEKQLTLRADSFLSEIAGSNLDSALKSLLTRSPLAKEAERVDRLRTNLPALLQKYGSFRRTELLKTERFGQGLIRSTWLYHCAQYPVVFRFTFYRTQAGDASEWTLISLQFDTNYDLLATPGTALTPPIPGS